MGNEKSWIGRQLQRLSVRLIGATLAVLLGGLVYSSVVTILREQHLLSEQLKTRGESLAELAAVPVQDWVVGDSDLKAVSDFAQSLVTEQPDVIYAQIRRASDNIILGEYGPPGTRDDGTFQEFTARVLEPQTYGHNDPKLLAMVYLHVSTQALVDLKESRRKELMIQGGLVFLALATVLFFLLQRTVAGPVERLERQAIALGRGDLDSPIQLRSRDELGSLAATLDEVRRNLRSSYSEVRTANEELKRVGIEKDETMEQLAHALERANEASRTKSEFLATMSHEIRTPMNGVLGMTDLLLDAGLSGEQRELAETVRSSAESLLMIVNDILDFSKIDAKRMRLDPVPISLRKVVKDSLAMLGDAARSKGLTLTCTFREDVPDAVVGDPLRIRQVLLNLLNNAIKFTAKGSVTLNVSLDHAEETRVCVRFGVQDTGIGISSTGLSRLFKPFSQADSSMSRRYGGTGLGLAICKHLAELMGGEIGIESTEGVGSLFWFTVLLQPNTAGLVEVSSPEVSAIPAALPAHSPTSAGDTTMTTRPSDTRILLVEDNRVNQRLALKLLEKRGYEVGVAGNGIEALDLLSTGAYDLILMDCQMPELDGFETTQRIRELEAGRKLGHHIPIVAMTANALRGDRELCIKAGMDDYLAKPVRAEALYQMIESVLARLRPSSKAGAVGS